MKKAILSVVLIVLGIDAALVALALMALHR